MEQAETQRKRAETQRKREEERAKARRVAICRAWMEELAAANTNSEKRRITNKIPSECDP